MKTATYYALKCLQASSIHSFPVTSDDIVRVLAGLGYTTKSYTLSSSKTIAAFRKNNVLGIAKQHEGFTYVSSGSKVVFYRGTLGSNKKRNVLAHELGHIVMQHTSPCGVLGFSDNFLIDSAQEKEANYFAIAFLAPPCVLKHARITTAKAIADNTLLDEHSSALAMHLINDINPTPTTVEKELCTRFSGFIRDSNRKLLLRFLLMLLPVVAAVVAMLSPLSTSDGSYQYQPLPTPYVTPQPTPAPTIEPNVIVTKSGKRYHLPNCSNVKNRTNTSALDKQTAESLGYTPCKQCNP